LSIVIGSVPSKHDPADSLADIIENAERVELYSTGMDRQAFERDEKTRFWPADAASRPVRATGPHGGQGFP
jgi:uncharacterized protein with HEPN domain